MTPFSQMTGGAAPANDEEADIDAYIKEIEDKKQETFETGKMLVKAALEAEMIVGSWYVPDYVQGEVNPLELAPIVGKVAKAVKVGQMLGKAVGVANKLDNKDDIFFCRSLLAGGNFVSLFRAFSRASPF